MNVHFIRNLTIFNPTKLYIYIYIYIYIYLYIYIYIYLNLNGIRRKEANSGYYIRRGCARMLLSVYILVYYYYLIVLM